jgi:hypothetical protein
LDLPPGQRVVAIFAAPRSSTHAALQACTVVTTTSVFDIYPSRKPEEIFLQMLDGSRDPEPLGASLRLDLKSLYEEGTSALLVYLCGGKYVKERKETERKDPMLSLPLA